MAIFRKSRENWFEEREEETGKKKKKKRNRFAQRNRNKGSHGSERRRVLERFPIFGFRPLWAQFYFLPCGSRKHSIT